MKNNWESLALSLRNEGSLDLLERVCSREPWALGPGVSEQKTVFSTRLKVGTPETNIVPPERWYLGRLVSLFVGGCVCVCVCVDLLKRSKTCTWISIFGSLWDLYLDGILTNLTYMKFKLQILYWFIARLRGLPLWYFIFGWHAYYFNLHEVCSFKFYSGGRRDTSLGRR